MGIWLTSNNLSYAPHDTCHANNIEITLTICPVRADLEARAGIKISPETSMIVQQANAPLSEMVKEAKGEEKERLHCLSDVGGPVSV